MHDRFHDATEVTALFEQAAAALRAAPPRRGSAVRLPTRGRLLATGDLHDNPFHLEKIVAAARLEASGDHHVVLHELIHGERLVNGLDFSYRMLARVAALVVRYPAQVHPLLANHELAQMTGKAVSKGAGNSVELFRDALEYAFGEEAVGVEDAINGFIAAFPLAALSEGGVCCAHSLPAPRALAHFDAGVLDRPLDEADYLGPHGSAYLMTWGRGADDAVTEQLAARWDVRLFCLGHEHVETGIEQRGARVIILNSDHERATVLPIDLSTVPDPSAALFAAIPLASVGIAR